MNQGWVFISALLIFTGLVHCSKKKTTKPTEDTPPVPKGNPPPKKSVSLTFKEYNYGKPNEPSSIFRRKKTQLKGAFQGGVQSDEYEREGQPFKANVLRYTTKIGDKLSKQVEIRITEEGRPLEYFIAGCKTCDRPQVYIGNNKIAIYNEKDVYGVLAHKGKPYIVMKYHICEEKGKPTKTVKTFELMDEFTCRTAISEMKHPQRISMLTTVILFLRKHGSKPFDFLEKYNLLTPYLLPRKRKSMFTAKTTSVPSPIKT